MATWDEIIPGSIGLLLTGGAAGFFLREWVRVLLSQRWPSVQGEIVSAQLVDRRSGKSWLTTAEISYRYEVGGRSYKANRICFGDYLTGNAGVARDRLRMFTRGSGVTVFYNPRRPEDAVLLRKGTLMLAVWPVLALSIAGAIASELFG